jgi:hypothetical protein
MSYLMEGDSLGMDDFEGDSEGMLLGTLLGRSEGARDTDGLIEGASVTWASNANTAATLSILNSQVPVQFPVNSSFMSAVNDVTSSIY